MTSLHQQEQSARFNLQHVATVHSKINLDEWKLSRGWRKSDLPKVDRRVLSTTVEHNGSQELPQLAKAKVERRHLIQGKAINKSAA